MGMRIAVTRFCRGSLPSMVKLLSVKTPNSESQICASYLVRDWNPAQALGIGARKRCEFDLLYRLLSGIPFYFVQRLIVNTVINGRGLPVEAEKPISK